MRCRPASALMSVVLPAPFGPTTQTSSRSPMASDTSTMAAAAPYETRMRSTSSMRFTQIRLHDRRPAHHFGRTALGDHAAVAQHHDAVGELHHRAHHVLVVDDSSAHRAAVALEGDGTIYLC